MDKKCAVPLLCLVICCTQLLPAVLAQNSSQVTISSQGSISYSSPTNLAVIPDAWNLRGYGSVPQYAFVDYSVTHNGNPSIRLEPGGVIDSYGVVDRAIWLNKWHNVKAGDRVVASIWMKTSNSSKGDIIGGARLGIDLYDNSGVVDAYPHWGDEDLNCRVHWGTSDWTLRTWDIIVPAGKNISSVVIWIQAIDGDDLGIAWFADAELYIYPS